MKVKSIKAMISMAKVVVSAVAVIGGMMCVNTQEAKAEDIIHTHIWATKYDDSKHWEYCTVCSKTRDTAEHKCVDNWKDGKESCWANNYSVRVCECGYSYTYKKECTNIKGWISATNRLVHYKYCADCRAWTKTEACKDNEGTLSCKNPGTCTDCYATYTSNAHYIKSDGTCRDCGIKLIKMSKPTVKYAEDMSYAEVTVTIESLHESLQLTGNIDAHTTDNATKKLTWTSKKIDDKTMSYTGKYTFDVALNQVISFDLQNHSDAFRFNGMSITSDLNLQSVKLSPDKEKPTVTAIDQKDQTLYNTWATIKELTIKGTENLSNVVSITIKDKQTGDIMVDKAEAEVKDKKFTYMCTPELEGPVEGRTYILIVDDNMGNKLEQDFVIFKTDCRAPILRSSKEFVKWSKTKNIIFKLTDYGSGGAQTSLLDQVSYKKAELVDGYYNAKYTFDEDNYGVTEYKLYIRDGLGNARLETVKVGKVDNTKPTVTEIANEVITSDSSKPMGVLFTIKANDINTKLNAEGSGVAGYAITKSEDKPADSVWGESNELKVTEPGKYYLWVKDLAGNIADIQIIIVNDDFSVEIDSNAVIEVDNKEDVTIDEVIADDKENKTENKKEESKKDKTPDTGDSSLVVIVLVALLISGGVLVYIKKKKASMHI